jgi:hypothetical protein
MEIGEFKPKKRQQITIGSIVEIEIENSYFVYAQIVPTKNLAIFDFRTNEKLTDFNILLEKKVLFLMATYNYIITKGHWLKVGKLPIREDLLVSPNQFISTFPGDYRLYNPNTGTSWKVTKEECMGLECCAVWDWGSTEQRISDHYNGVPNIWEKYDILE